jgi:hypothetical protein
MRTTLDRQAWFTYILVTISIALVFVWFSFPPPLFEGIPRLVCIAYFVALSGVSVNSFVWLLRHSRSPLSEETSSGSRHRMVALLAMSLLVMVGSAFFVLFALLAGASLRMI